MIGNIALNSIVAKGFKLIRMPNIIYPKIGEIAMISRAKTMSLFNITIVKMLLNLLIKIARRGIIKITRKD